MNLLQERAPTRDDNHDGGFGARRAVIRWAWRLFRRQWRAQALVLALLTLAVAGATGGAAAAYNLAPAPGNAVSGSAAARLVFDEPDPRGLSLDLAAAEEWFGNADLIGRRLVPLPGLFEPIEFRVQDPDGVFSEPMLAIQEGRYPVSVGEVALTDETARTLEVGVGGRLDLAGDSWDVVGLVENPSDLSDEFALLAPSEIGGLASATFLVDGDESRLSSFHAPSGALFTSSGRPGNEDVLAAIGVLAAATILLLLVSLIAAAGFVVIAQRRLRQLGMLAAIGATESNLRLVMVANGALIGCIAALAGSLTGLGVWLALVSRLEVAVGHRIAPFDVPWWLIATSMALAFLTATGAAWWPARTVSRTPIVSALSGRPPKPLPARRSTSLAVPLVAGGAAFLFLSRGVVSNWLYILSFVGGVGALIFGVLLVSPLAIRFLARLGARSSVAVRLAFRDLARYQARSGAALAAISLTLGIAATVVITSSAALNQSDAEGNLSSTQLLVRVGEIPSSGDVAPIPERSQAEVEELDVAVDEIAVDFPGATITPVDVAVAADLEGFGGLPAVVLAEQLNPGLHRIITFLYVATPEILTRYEVDLDALAPGTEVLTTEEGELWFQPVETEEVLNPVRLTPGHRSVPGSFITPEALEERGWEKARAAWLIESDEPITDDQFATALDLAAAAGMTVEVREDQANLAALRLGATVVGIAVALGVLGMTVGLIRTEAVGDLRILTATGATRGIRRTLAAATAGGLALLGAVLGTSGAYLGLIAGGTADLAPVPVTHLAIICIGLPLAAAVAGWVFVGHQPSVLARQPIE